MLELPKKNGQSSGLLPAGLSPKPSPSPSLHCVSSWKNASAVSAQPSSSKSGHPFIPPWVAVPSCRGQKSIISEKPSLSSSLSSRWSMQPSPSLSLVEFFLQFVIPFLHKSTSLMTLSLSLSLSSLSFRQPSPSRSLDCEEFQPTSPLGQLSNSSKIPSLSSSRSSLEFSSSHPSLSLSV